MSSNIKINKECVHCGESFEAKTLYTRYCSKVCNDRDYKNRIKKSRVDFETLNKNKNVPEFKEFSIVNKFHMNITEASVYLGVSKRTVERLISAGSLNVKRIQRRVIISKIELDNL